MLTLKAPCKILMSSKSAWSRFTGMTDKYHADAVDPNGLKCLRCGDEWEGSPECDPRTVTCSNCYSDRIVLTSVRLGFENWGKHNGGEKEQRGRYEHARALIAAARPLVEPKEPK